MKIAYYEIAQRLN